MAFPNRHSGFKKPVNKSYRDKEGVWIPETGMFDEKGKPTGHRRNKKDGEARPHTTLPKGFLP